MPALTRRSKLRQLASRLRRCRPMAFARELIDLRRRALSNLVFCERGTRVLQILAPGMMEREYRTLSHHGRLRHDYVVAQFATTEDERLPVKDRDLVLDPEFIAQTLTNEEWARPPARRA